MSEIVSALIVLTAPARSRHSISSCRTSALGLMRGRNQAAGMGGLKSMPITNGCPLLILLQCPPSTSWDTAMTHRHPPPMLGSARGEPDCGGLSGDGPRIRPRAESQFTILLRCSSGSAPPCLHARGSYPHVTSAFSAYDWVEH